MNKSIYDAQYFEFENKSYIKFNILTYFFFAGNILTYFDATS